MVLDASMALSWFMERTAKAERLRSDKALALLDSSAAMVPVLWFSEVANACLVAERRRIVTPAQTADYLGRLAALPIAPDPIMPGLRRDAVLGLGREHGLSAYDAAYLELAMRAGAALATFDTALTRAAVAVGVIIL